MTDNSVLVKVSEGQLSGFLSKSSAGHDYSSFLGIPFAEPPVGLLRFRKPLPARPWKGTRDASRYGSMGPQWDPQEQCVVGSEDCLYLNVFSRAAGKNGRPLLPVIVWIHGGAFNSGSGDDLWYGPQKAMDTEIVLVTLNYRLGPFGLMTFMDDAIPVNLAIDDQILALEWIQRNIASFGGDPTNVTIAGESSGAACVGFHLLDMHRDFRRPPKEGSPKKLFHKAILQSGGPVTRLSLSVAGDTGECARRLARGAGVENPERMTSHQLRDVFMTLDTATLVRSMHAMGHLPNGPQFKLVVPPGRSPWNELESGSADLDMPVIAGCNRDEGAWLAYRLAKKPTLTAGLRAGDPSYCQLCFKLNSPAEGGDLLESYFPGGAVDWRSLGAAYNDFVSYGMWRGAELIAEGNEGNTYLYRYTHMGESRFTQLFGHDWTDPSDHAGDLGSGHFDEILLQFRNKLFPAAKPGSPDDLMSSRLWRLWADFALTGRPHPLWEPARRQQHAELERGQFSMRENATVGFVAPAFWERSYRRFFGGNKSKL